MARNVVLQNLIDELPVRIDDGNAVAGGDVSGKHVPQERALAGTGAAEERKVAAACGGTMRDRPAVMEGIFAAADEHGVKVHAKNYKVRSSEVE